MTVFGRSRVLAHVQTHLENFAPLLAVFVQDFPHRRHDDGVPARRSVGGEWQQAAAADSAAASGSLLGVVKGEPGQVVEQRGARAPVLAAAHEETKRHRQRQQRQRDKETKRHT